MDTILSVVALNQVAYHGQLNPPTPSVGIPPLPPTQAGMSSSGSLTADSGDVGNSWGGYSHAHHN